MDLGKQKVEEFKILTKKLVQHMPLSDLATVLFPPAMGLDLLSGLMSKEPIKDDGFNPEYPEPELLETVLELARWLSLNYFKTQILNVDNIPNQGPVLFVGNHNAGLMPIDSLFAIDAIKTHSPNLCPVHPLAHDFVYKAPRVAKCAKRLGILRADKTNALLAINAGRSVLVYPGGDEEAFRTFSERNRIILAGRKGFIRIAAAAKIPIVPIVSAGLHESFIVLSKGREIGKKLGLKKLLRTEILPLSLSFPWGLGLAFAPFLPLPTSVDICFLPPVFVDVDSENEQSIEKVYEHISTVMQTKMDELTKNRAPFWGR